MTKQTIFFTGGGTSGHINPALAIAKELRSQRPDIDIVFTGTKRGLEADIVPREGFEFIPITASPFKRKLSKALVQAVIDLFRGKRECLHLLDTRQPIAVVGTGGYVAGPLLAAAKKRKTPYLIHEQNAYPGQSNLVMAAGAAAVCLSYEEARPYFKKSRRVELTGNPIAPEYFDLERSAARQKLGLSEGEFRILVSGGSLGAKQLNETVIAYLHKHQESFDGRVLLVAGKTQYEDVLVLAEGIDPKKLEIVSYLYDMPYHMAAADLYICRAGAGTCAEVSALGQASIMVPYPYATGDHQTHNAEAFRAIGAALLCPNDRFNVSYLEANLDALRDPAYRAEMGRLAKTLAKPKAAEDIVSVLRSIIE